MNARPVLVIVQDVPTQFDVPLSRKLWIGSTKK